jgi:hypothetical protein
VFGKLLSYATSGITNLIAKYAVRATVAVPFVFALAFGLAGLTVILIDAFGHRDAYLLLAGAFLALGVVAAVAVWAKERSDEAESNAGIQTGSGAAVAAMAVETAKQVPSAIAAGTADTSSSFRGLAKLAERNWPLAIAAAAAILLLGGLFSENRYGNRLRSRY